MEQSDFIKNTHKTNVLFDTNILLLWVIGSISRNLISEHKRTRNYVPDHYDALIEFKRRRHFRTIVVTPHVLAECSGLARQISEPQKTWISQRFLQTCNESQEIYTLATKITKNPNFQKLGLTDAGILDTLDQNRIFLLTADLDLFIAARKRGHAAANFNHFI